MKSWIYILVLALAACSPGFEAGDPIANPLKTQDNTQPAGEDLGDLFSSQDQAPTQAEEGSSDDSRTDEGPVAEFPTFIGEGHSPAEAQSESPEGPAPIDMDQEERDARVAGAAPAQVPRVEEPPVSAPEEAPEEIHIEVPPVLDESPAVVEEDRTPEEPLGEAAPLAPVALDAGPEFRNPHAAAIFERADRSLRIPFRMSPAYGRFSERFDHYLSGLTPREVTAESREYFRIPRCSGTEEATVQTHWPHWSDRILRTRPIGMAFVPGLGNVDVYSPLALLDAKDTYESHNINYEFPFYDVLAEVEFEKGIDPLTAHSVVSRDQLAFLSVATAKEVFEHSMSHVFQMTVDSRASLSLSQMCLEGQSTTGCQEYESTFEIHQRAHQLQRLALAISLADERNRCQTAVGDWADNQACFFSTKLSHSPELWNLKTYYNPLKNLMRKSSDIDHWGNPEELTEAETAILRGVLAELSSLAEPAEAYRQLKDKAEQLYKNITLLFPALRFVDAAELSEQQYIFALNKVSGEIDELVPGGGDRIYYEQFKNLRFFPLATMARMDERTPVEVCDITEEILSPWDLGATLDGQLALDQSFYLIPLELHRFVPPQALLYPTFGGKGWQYLAETFYDFAESRVWAFTIQAGSPELRVTSQETSQVAEELLRQRGLQPAEQTEFWTSGTTGELFKSLMLP